MDNELALIHGSPLVPTDQDLPDDGSGISYHLHVGVQQLKNERNLPIPNIYQVTVTAKWTSDGQKEDRSLSELVYQP
jgi:hypothetical protein